MNLTPALYIIATPIGNLQDITLRALEVLSACDVIYCEDTRVSAKMLAKHQIKAPLRVYNDNSSEFTRQQIKQLIVQGKIVGLISDAGSPLIADPGYKLVKYLQQHELLVDVIPGPCALIGALTVAGLPTDQFYFAGFLPKTANKRQQIITQLQTLPATIIFYETANRLLDSLQQLHNILGNRQASVVRELTKLYQEVKTKPLDELSDYYRQHPPRGEVVLLIEGAKQQSPDTSILVAEIEHLLSKNLSAKTISQQLSNKYPLLSRKQIYAMVHNITKTV